MKLYLQSSWTVFRGVGPDRTAEVITLEGNMFLQGGLQQLKLLIMGATVKPFGSDARLGVGKSNKPEEVTQNDLQDTPTWITLNPGFPTLDKDGSIIFEATADGPTANHRWEELGLRAGDGTLLNRKVSYLGEKVAGSVWTLQFRLSLVVKEA